MNATIKFISITISLIVSINLFAQNDPKWDDTAKSKWKSDFEEVTIPSSVDGSPQKAFLYRTKSKTPKPLIVSLHTWSGDYAQRDPLVNEIAARDWNYLHPDFRGPNNKPAAMGSPLVISDIEDAVRFAVEQTNTDTENVHIIGPSGGGYATLLAYMNIQYPVKSFSAWVPISDIEAWYWESVGRSQRYAKDILDAVSVDGTFNKEEAQRRSPLFQNLPEDSRKNSKLFIYTGIHDGYEGSVPITHSINMYNRIVGEMKYKVKDIREIMNKVSFDPDLVSEREIIDLVTKRINPAYDKEQTMFGRNIYLSRDYENIHLTVFEGNHEQIPQALALIPVANTTSLKYNILTIGDSNAQNKDGWVDQLKVKMPESRFVNISRGGRTIGFDNNGSENLNTLKNIDDFLDQAGEQIGKEKYDYIIVSLGTNDTKKEFAEKQEEVVRNFEKLLDKIKTHRVSKSSKPKFIFITPPPMRTEDMEEKYQGGNERLSVLIPKLESIAAKKKFIVINVYNPLTEVFNYYAPDGVHMVGAGQEIIALKIIDTIQNRK